MTNNCIKGSGAADAYLKGLAEGAKNAYNKGFVEGKRIRGNCEKPNAINSLSRSVKEIDAEATAKDIKDKTKSK